MARLGIWIEATRPKTLPAAVCPVALGTALAFAEGAFRPVAALICLGFALLIQIGTNFANDYLDGVRGSDTASRLGPVRAVASGLVSPPQMRRAAVLTLALAFLLGLSLIPFGGWGLLAIGIASVLCAWLYTGGPYPFAYNALGDVFVVLFFGFVAVGATYYVQAGRLSPEALLLGLGCGVLVNNILVVNNYRDMEEDRQGGKRTLVVVFGRAWARVQYVVSGLLAGGVLVWLCFRGFGAGVLLGLPAALVSVWLGFRLGGARSAQDFLAALKRAGLVVAAYGLLAGLGLVLGA